MNRGGDAAKNAVLKAKDIDVFAKRSRKQDGPKVGIAAAGNGIFGCRDEAPNFVIQTRERRQRPKSRN
jgi:hypothetical protein